MQLCCGLISNFIDILKSIKKLDICRYIHQLRPATRAPRTRCTNRPIPGKNGGVRSVTAVAWDSGETGGRNGRIDVGAHSSPPFHSVSAGRTDHRRRKIWDFPPPRTSTPLPDPNPSLTLNPNRHLALTTLTLTLNVIPHRARIANYNTNSVLNNPTLYNPKY